GGPRERRQRLDVERRADPRRDMHIRRGLAGRDEAEMALAQDEPGIARYRAEACYLGQMPGERGFEDRAVTRPGYAVEDRPGDGGFRIVAGKAGDQRRGRGALAFCVDDQHDRPPGQAGERGGRGLVAVEQPHDALADGEIGVEPGDQPGDGRRPHRPGVEVDAGRAAGQRVKARVDIVGPGLGGGDTPAPPAEFVQDCQGHQGLAAARGGCGDDQPPRGHAGSNQASVSPSRATSPMTITAGGSIRSAAASVAAAPSVVVSTRCAAVVALLTIAAGSSRPRPASINRSAIAARWLRPIYSTSTGAPWAIAPQSRVSGAAPPSCPVTSVTAELMPRWVSGMPA